MSDGTHIGWTNATWNVLVGCTKKSKGCQNCSAIRDAQRLSHNPHPKIAKKYAGTVTADGRNWTGRINFDEDTLLLPLHWRKPRMIFVNYTSDTFHANVPDGWIDRLFAVMSLCPQHTFQVLTKRIDRARDYLALGVEQGRRVVLQDAATGWTAAVWMHSASWPLPNVHLVTSIEDQETADERIPFLLQARAVVRGVSVEPLLGPINLHRVKDPKPAVDVEGLTFDALSRKGGIAFKSGVGLDWVIVGGESGAKARPMHPEWVRSLRDQCERANVPFYFKQWGEYMPVPLGKCSHPSSDGAQGPSHLLDQVEIWKCGVCGELHDLEFDFARVGKKNAGRLLDGREHSEFPHPSAE